MQEPKASRRIVSWGAYVKVQSRKMWLWLIIVLAPLVAAVCLIVSINNLHVAPSLAKSLLACLCVSLSYGLFSCAVRSLQIVRFIEPITLFTIATRANTANFNAHNSLVRASQEPTQAQQTVLLRATTQDTTPFAEQLLRASGKQGQE